MEWRALGFFPERPIRLVMIATAQTRDDDHRRICVDASTRSCVDSFENQRV